MISWRGADFMNRALKEGFAERSRKGVLQTRLASVGKAEAKRIS